MASTGPRQVDAWSLSAGPIAEVNVNGPVEEVPLDPVSVFEGPDKSIVVGDGNLAGWDAVLVFDSLGRFQRSMGGNGQGPGEFRDPLSGAIPYAADSIAAWDASGSVHFFGPGGGFGRRLLLPDPPVSFRSGPITSGPKLMGTFPDGRLLSTSTGRLELPESDGDMPFRYLLFVVDPDGMAWDTIGTFRSPPKHLVRDGEPSAYLVPHLSFDRPYGSLWIRANSTAFEYRVMGLDGSLQSIVRRPFLPQPVSRADVDARIDWALAVGDRASLVGQAGWGPIQRFRTRQRMMDQPWGDTMPELSNILSDPEGNVWVERFRWSEQLSLPPVPQPSVWDIFSGEGEWITALTVPERVVLHSVSVDRVYATRIDQNYMRHVVVFGLDRTH